MLQDEKAGEKSKLDVDEESQLLDELHQMTIGLKEISHSIGNELDAQSDMLNRLDKKMDLTSNKLDKVTKKTKKFSS